jgi:hypothetical protein
LYVKKRIRETRNVSGRARAQMPPATDSVIRGKKSLERDRLRHPGPKGNEMKRVASESEGEKKICKKSICQLGICSLYQCILIQR